MVAFLWHKQSFFWESPSTYYQIGQNCEILHWPVNNYYVAFGAHDIKHDNDYASLHESKMGDCQSLEQIKFLSGNHKVPNINIKWARTIRILHYSSTSAPFVCHTKVNEQKMYLEPPPSTLLPSSILFPTTTFSTYTYTTVTVTVQV